MNAGSIAPKKSADSGEIDVLSILRLLRSRAKWILGATAVVFVATMFFVNVVKPRYSSEARVLLEIQDAYATHNEKAEGPGGIDAEAVGSQLEVIKSRDLARRVIKKLELSGNPEFDPVAGGLGVISHFMTLLGLSRDPTSQSSEDRIMEAYFQKLHALSPNKTRVINIEFQSSNPDMAARGANAIADAYIEFRQEAKRDNARAAAASLSTYVSELKTRLGAAEAQAEDFRSHSGLYLGSNNASLNAQQLAEVSTELSRARTAQADAQAKARLIREMVRQGRINEIPDVANNDLVRRISEQRVSLRAQLAFESRTLLPAHPRIRELEGQLAELEAQLRAAAEKTARTLENDARIAGARVENLNATLDAQKKVIGASTTDEIQLRDYERSAKLLKDDLEAATAKLQEALAMQNSQAIPADARIISRALAPESPAFPKKTMIVGFATLGALMLSIGLAIGGYLMASPQNEIVQTLPAIAPMPQSEDFRYTKKPFEASLDTEDLSVREAFLHNADAIQSATVHHTGKKQESAIAEEKFSGAQDANDASTATTRPASLKNIRSYVAAPNEPANNAAEQTFEILTSLARLDQAGGPSCFVSALLSEDAQDDGFALAVARKASAEGRAVLVALEQGIMTPLPARIGLGELVEGDHGFVRAIQRDPATRLHFIVAGNAKIEDAGALGDIFDALAETYEYVLIGATHEVSIDIAHVLAARARFAAVFAHTASGAEALSDAFESCGGVSPIVVSAGADTCAA